jgi:hypothetical protein
MTKNMTVQVPPSPTGIYTISVGAGGGGGTIGDINGTGGSGMTIGGILNNGNGAGGFKSHLIDPSVFDHYIKDHEIQGQTVLFEFKTPLEQFDRPLSEKDIKERLVRGLIDEIVKEKCIEFTQMARHDINEMIYRARVHVVPDTQVRIIRELKNAKQKT